MKKQIQFTATLVREPLKPKSDNWQETAHKWNVIINGEEFDYYTGVGHREAKAQHMRSSGYYTYNELKNTSLNTDGLKQLLSISKPTPPKLDDVLYSLISDADANEMSFSEWCDNLGYDTDSRKALTIYEQCQNSADKLIKAGINIVAERERLQDY